MIERKRQTIMLVDDNQANLNIGKNMLKGFYEVYALPSAERLFKFLEAVTPDLILLDIAMPGMNGFDVIRILKADTRYKNIPVIFVTAKSEEMNELEGLDLGAVDYVTKPFSAAILLKRIENQLLIEKQKAELRNLNDNLIGMVKEKTAQVSGLQSSIINIIAELVEFRDLYTGGHISRTQKYVELLIDSMVEDGVYNEEVLQWENMDYIVPSTQLHDLGKIFISDTILNKPGKLTPEEFDIMKSHAARGVEAIKMLEAKGEDQLFLRYSEIVAGSHHEKWDGSGYPNGLKGQEIPLLGRLMAIADVYDALTSARPYKEPFSPEESADIIIKSAGSHFDPVLVDVFIKIQDGFASVVEKPEAASELPQQEG
ncbi:MAG: response regulator [Clostridiales bacterium]|jgi:putative two-component system response regulator|nr:response regulator [Clostridiales bacterium]